MLIDPTSIALRMAQPFGNGQRRFAAIDAAKASTPAYPLARSLVTDSRARTALREQDFREAESVSHRWQGGWSSIDVSGGSRLIAFGRAALGAFI